MVAPFRVGRNLLENACPMQQILDEVSTQLAEAKALKEGGPIVGSA